MANESTTELPIESASRARTATRFLPARWPTLGLSRPRIGSGLGIPQGRSGATALLRDRRYRRLLVAGDLVSVSVAAFIAVNLLGRSDSLQLTAIVALPVVVLIGKLGGRYDRDENLLNKTTLEEAPGLFQFATLVALVVWLAEPLFVSGEVGRDQVLGLWGLLFVGMLTARTGARRLAREVTPPERCLVLGNAKDAERISHKVVADRATSASIVGRIPFTGEERANGHRPPVVGSMSTLGLALEELDVDRLVIAPGASDSEAILDAIRHARALGVKVSVLPRLFEVVGSSVEFDSVEGAPLLGLRPEGLTRSSQVLKRAMDLVGATAGLIVLAPLMAWIALAVKVSSPGPVLFRQKRIGREGEEFEMLKFRTMRDGAEAEKDALRGDNETEGLFKIGDDPRITRVGSFLRGLSLDELPQLVNVVKGEMSLVGPRPLVPDEDRQIEGWGRRRLHVAPGMTGVWQLFGPTRIPMQEMVKLDYVYGAHWSVWLDVKILLRTIPHALARRGL